MSGRYIIDLTDWILSGKGAIDVWRHAIISKNKTVNLVVLESSYEGAYTRANTNVAAIDNVMKQVDNFIFARSG